MRVVTDVEDRSPRLLGRQCPAAFRVGCVDPNHWGTEGSEVKGWPSLSSHNRTIEGPGQPHATVWLPKNERFAETPSLLVKAESGETRLVKGLLGV